VDHLGGLSDLAVVWAKAEEGIRGFIVPRNTPGFTVIDIHKKMSLRASGDLGVGARRCAPACRRGAARVVGLKGPLSCLNEARYGILWGATGAARACYEAALDYAKGRMMFGRPIAGFQLIQRQLVEMMVAVNEGMLVALHIGRMKDAGPIDPAHISFGKFDNVRRALEVARTARSVLGANGITLDYPAIRHMKTWSRSTPTKAPTRSTR